MSNKIVKTLVYYSPHRQQAFEVSVSDESGKPMYERTPLGELKLGKNKAFIPVTRLEKFKTLIDSPKVGYQCVYRVDFVLNAEGEEVPVDKNVFAVLEKLADDPSTKIIREEQYRQQINPAAFELEKKLKEKDQEVAILRRELAENQAKSSDAMSEFQKQLTELKAQLDKDNKPESSQPTKTVRKKEFYNGELPE